MDARILLVALVIVVIVVAVRAYMREGRRLANRTPAELDADRMKVRHEVFPEWLADPRAADRFLSGMDALSATEWRLKFRRYAHWRAEGREHTEALIAAEHPHVPDDLLFGPDHTSSS